MKGAVDIITIIIVACVVVSIGLMLWFYLSSYYSQVSSSGGVSTAKSLATLSSCMRIEEATQNKFFIRNCGTGLITDNSLNVYIDDNRFSFSLSPASIDSGKTGTLSLQGAWGLPIGQHTLRITNPNFETSAMFDSELPDSCVLALDFDEGSGTIAHDFSSYHNDGALRNLSAIYTCGTNGACPSWVYGKFGKALDFDGVGDFVNVSNIAANTSAGAFNTVAFWMYWKGGGTDQIPFIWLGQNYDIILSGICFGFNTVNLDMTGTLLSGLANRWVHVTAVFYNGVPSSSNVLLYIDGAKQTYPPSCIYGTSFSKSVSTNIEISGRASSSEYFFNGMIDSVRIFNTSLTPDQTLNFRLI